MSLPVLQDVILDLEKWGYKNDRITEEGIQHLVGVLRDKPL